MNNFVRLFASLFFLLTDVIVNGAVHGVLMPVQGPAMFGSPYFARACISVEIKCEN
jgi:hypothetical protein